MTGARKREHLYYRGLCSAKTGKIAEAVSDLQRAAKSGHSRARTLRPLEAFSCMAGKTTTQESYFDYSLGEDPVPLSVTS